MFHSINDAWFSASQNNMADVKELVPEFFYLPEMFENSNHFEFGIYRFVIYFYIINLLLFIFIEIIVIIKLIYSIYNNLFCMQ